MPGWARITLDDELAQGQADVDVLGLDKALSELAAFDARKSQVAELRFFAGLSQAWTAQHRLPRRYRPLAARGKPKQLIVTAVARELTGFLWVALTQ